MTQKVTASLLLAYLLASAAHGGTKQPDLRGTDSQPLVIKTVPTPKSAEDGKRDEQHSAERARDLQDRANDLQAREGGERWERGIGIATILILMLQAGAFFYQGRKMRESVDEMRATTAVALEANNLTRKTLGAELRPWIRLKLKLIGPPSYDPQRTEWRFDFEYTLENVGKTPATKVKFFANVIPFQLEQGPQGGKPGVERTDISAALREWSDRTSSNAQAETPGLFGSLIFPGDARTGNYGIQCGDAQFLGAMQSPAYSGQFAVLTSVSYRSSIDDSWHVTAVAYNLFLQSSSKNPSSKFDVVNGSFDVDGRAITFIPHPWADNYVR